MHRFDKSKLADPIELPDQRIQEKTMIRPLPSYIGFQYRLVPVFTWQKIPNTEQNPIDSNGTTVDPAPVGSSNQTSAPENSPAGEQAADLRLVFSGYRWRAVAHFEQTPNRGYERFTETDPTDAAERARNKAIERQQIQSAQTDAATERQINTAHAVTNPREKDD